MQDHYEEPPLTRCSLDRTIKAYLRTEYAVIQALPVVFRYDVTDPHVVALQFGNADKGVCSWIIGREQLLEGILHGFDTAALTIREIAVLSPGGVREPTMLRLTLRNASKWAVFELPADAVRDWLAGTFDLVAAGDEGAALDWDFFLVRLTNEWG